MTDTAIAEKIGVTKHLLGKWKKGISRPSYEALEKISEITGRSIDYFVTGYLINLHYEDNPLTNESYGITPIYTSGNALSGGRSGSVRKPQKLHKGPRDAWPVRGLAAADDTAGTRVPLTDDFDEPVDPPDGMMLVPVTGSSMSPLILSGQFAIIDAEREGLEVSGGIVVASIVEPEPGDPRSESITGTVVKRCYDLGDKYNFVSINNYPPFTAFKDHCRVWPVIGVWFGGKGKAPKV
ncbi:MAG: helix-turn-helix domain-containing protein [Planctomycetaceae bacterium]|nr:helix-turn-helix domain-containing protein [Planctomycetaceae bacterium]